MRPPATAGVESTPSPRSMPAIRSNFGPAFSTYVLPCSLVTYSRSPTRTGELVNAPSSRSDHTSSPVLASKQVATPPSLTTYSRPSWYSGDGTYVTPFFDRQATCDFVTSPDPSAWMARISFSGNPPVANTCLSSTAGG